VTRCARQLGVVAVAVCVLVAGEVSHGAGPAAAASPGVALLVAVEAHDMGTFDRVTFFFRTTLCIDYCSGPVVNPAPILSQAEYVGRPVLADPSGQEVDVAGTAVMRITMSNASGVDLSVNPPLPTYTGPLRIQPDLPNVIDIVEVGDFEGVLSWAIGIRSSQVTAQAQVLQPAFGPIEVVVDVPHATPTAVLLPPSFTG
jgi:hypothetical protein